MKLSLNSKSLRRFARLTIKSRIVVNRFRPIPVRRRRYSVIGYNNDDDISLLARTSSHANGRGNSETRDEFELHTFRVWQTFLLTAANPINPIAPSTSNPHDVAPARAGQVVTPTRTCERFFFFSPEYTRVVRTRILLGCRR